jgi:MSHA biogenesis protein MshO
MKLMPRQLRGFTLIELIMVIVITGIIASVVGVFIRQPVEGYMDLTRRAELLDAAESALRLMAREIRRALPNSIRISGTTAIEMINTVDGVRYRHDPPGTPLQRLSFDTADQSFNAIGTFSTITKPFASAGERLVIYNLGGAGADAYDATTGVITPVGVTFTIDTDPAPPGGSGAEDQILLSAGHQFPFQSPRQRLFMVDGPISYICNTGTGFLRRYTGYALAAAQPVPPAVPGIPVTRFVTACTFTYAAGTAERAGLVTVALTLTDQGESINLLHQVHVDNVP